MPAATLARFVLLEALRSGLPWLAAAIIVFAAALAAYLSQVAVTESRALQASILSAVLRAGAVFLIATHVASSTLREINDKGLELMLALPLRRSTQYLGRLGGHAASGAVMAAAFALPLLFWAPPGAVALWALSLACETGLVVAASLFFSMTLSQLVPAMAATLGMYLLGRTITTIQAIASGPLAEPSLSSTIERAAVDGIALLVPRLDTVTRAEWLLYGMQDSPAYIASLAGLVLYAALLTAAGLFDFHRRSL